MANTAAENEADSGSGVATTHVKPEEDADQNESESVTGSNINYDNEGFKCTKCDFEASTQAALTVHISQVHTTSEVEMEVNVYLLLQFWIYLKYFGLFLASSI